MKNISIIGTVGIPAKYGGFETLVEYLAEHLADRYNITVFCSGRVYTEQPETYKNARLRYINLNANGVQSILYDIISIFKSLKFADTLLILGVSGCISLPFLRLFNRKKIIVNIDGLEWKRLKWKKTARMFLKLSERLAVRFADTVVTDNKVLQDYVKSEYGIDSKLIAYGADHVTINNLSDELKDKYCFLNGRYALNVCRIEPENNVQMLLEAFEEYTRLNLAIIGNWENSEYGRNLKMKYKNTHHIFLIDPIYDQQILNQIRSNSYIYLHGHSAGGTNPSLVEAMYLGLPVFAFGVPYNRSTTMNRARYFSDKVELVSLLNNTDDKELQTIASDNKIIAMKMYRWANISEQYSQLF